MRARAFAVTALAAVAIAGCSQTRDISGRPQKLELAIDSPKRSSVPVAASYGQLVTDGHYYTSLLRPALQFTAAEGWAHQGENHQELFLTRRSGLGWADIYVIAPSHRPFKVYNPPITEDVTSLTATTPDTNGDASAAARPPKAEPFPPDYFAYLKQSPYLQNESVEPAMLLGVDGLLLKATIALPVDYPAFFILFGVSGQELEPNGSALWVWSLDMPSGPVYVLAAAADRSTLTTDLGIAHILNSLKPL